MSTFFSIKEGLGARLKEARIAAGMHQKDLAAIGGVARATQVSYERGFTEPNTVYLRAIQDAGINVLHVLVGTSLMEPDAPGASAVDIDWERLRTAHEDVEFFCRRDAPNCPAHFRWMMVADLYKLGLKNGARRTGTMAVGDSMAVLTKLWKALA